MSISKTSPERKAGQPKQGALTKIRKSKSISQFEIYQMPIKIEIAPGHVMHFPAPDPIVPLITEFHGLHENMRQFENKVAEGNTIDTKASENYVKNQNKVSELEKNIAELESAEYHSSRLAAIKQQIETYDKAFEKKIVDLANKGVITGYCRPPSVVFAERIGNPSFGPRMKGIMPNIAGNEKDKDFWSDYDAAAKQQGK